MPEHPGHGPSAETSGLPADPPRKAALLAFAAAFALLTTVGAIHRAGLWDPPELEVAELSRRIAEGLLGAPGFGEAGREPVPTRGELGRGELPFTLMAAGFRAFGVVAWAGRLPLAISALVGLGALFVVLRRLVGVRAGALGVICLATMPLYFVQARTMLGEIVAMAASSVAMAGLALAVFDRSPPRARLACLGLGLGGLAAGFGARGLLVGVAVPALGVGLAWLLLALAGTRQDRLGAVLGAAITAGAAVAAGLGVLAIAQASPERYSMLVGAWKVSAPVDMTFDDVVRDLGHAIFPWSAVLPWAAGRLLGPVVTARGVSGERVQALRMVLLTSAGLALITLSAIETSVGKSAFVAPAALAGIVALALHDLEVGAPASRAFGLVSAALALVLLIDFQNFPDKALVPFGVDGVTLPTGFSAMPFAWLAAAVVAPVAVFFMIVQERSDAGQPAFRARDYLAWPSALSRLWNGNLLFGGLLCASGFLSLELFFALADRVPALQRFAAPGELSRALVRLGWVGILGVCVSPPVVLFGRDVIRVLMAPGARIRLLARSATLRRLEFGRGAAATVVLSLAGGFLAIGYYPALVGQLSPKQAAEAYLLHANRGEPLAAFGVSAPALRYEGVGVVEEHPDRKVAITWLTDGTARRFLVFRSGDLATLNASFRARARSNLPVLATGSSEFLLAVSRLEAAESSENPLDAIVLDRAPRPAYPLDVDLAGKLDVLGWEVQNTRGEKIDRVSAGEAFDFVVYYRVKDRVSGDWETFIHVDGFGRRYNGDHQTLGGRYPFSLWRVGDIIADRARLSLEPHFTPGSYDVYFGLFNGSRRLEVRRGPHEDDRIIAGTLLVR